MTTPTRPVDSVDEHTMQAYRTAENAWEVLTGVRSPPARLRALLATIDAKPGDTR